MRSSPPKKQKFNSKFLRELKKKLRPASQPAPHRTQRQTTNKMHNQPTISWQRGNHSNTETLLLRWRDSFEIRWFTHFFLYHRFSSSYYYKLPFPPDREGGGGRGGEGTSSFKRFPSKIQEKRDLVTSFLWTQRCCLDSSNIKRKSCLKKWRQIAVEECSLHHHRD